MKIMSTVVEKFKSFINTIKELINGIRYAKKYSEVYRQLAECREILLVNLTTYIRYKCYTEATEACKELDRIETMLGIGTSNHLENLMKTWESK